MKILLLTTLFALQAPTHQQAKVTRLKAQIHHQQEALDASQTALLYVITRWSSRGGTVADSEFILAVAALRKIEEARP